MSEKGRLIIKPRWAAQGSLRRDSSLSLPFVFNTEQRWGFRLRWRGRSPTNALNVNKRLLLTIKKIVKQMCILKTSWVPFPVSGMTGKLLLENTAMLFTSIPSKNVSEAQKATFLQVGRCFILCPVIMSECGVCIVRSATEQRSPHTPVPFQTDTKYLLPGRAVLGAMNRGQR